MRNPRVYIFYIDVGDLPQVAAMEHIQNIKESMSKRPEKADGDEDFFIANRDGRTELVVVDPNLETRISRIEKALQESELYLNPRSKMTPIRPTRAKFVVQSVTDNTASLNGFSVLLFPVVAGSGNAENDAFFEATPAGSIQLRIKSDAAKNFAVGDSFYVDFIPVPKI